MFKVEDIKSENSIVAFCHGCLSSDRLLTSLGALTGLYHKICFDFVSTIVKTEVSLCFECLAVLRKMHLFREKVNLAQKMLSYYHIKQEDPPHSISNLSSVKIDVEKSLYIVENVIEEKLPGIEENPSFKKKTDIEKNTSSEETTVEVKIEKNEHDDVFNYSDNEYTFLEDIKEEDELLQLVKEIKNESKHSTTTKTLKKKYKMFYSNLSAKSEVVTNEKIDQNELKIWFERERNSEYFKNLKHKCEKCVCRIRENTIKLHDRVLHEQRVGQFVCDTCQVRFPSKYQLALHMSHHYNIQRCNMCGYRCYTPAHMDYHLLSHAKSVQCLRCNACFANRMIFFEHYRLLHSIHICDYCNKKFKSRRAIINHIRNKHTRHECKICSVVFKRHDIKRRHMELKHVVNQTECAYCAQCGVQFDNEPLYKRHVATSVAHAAERKQKKKEKVQCTACPNVYSRKSYMMNHYRMVHEKSRKNYCQECDKYFLTGSRYREHRLYRHEGREKPKNHLCSICERGFNTKRILINHMRTHSGERPFMCSHCDSKFTQKQALTSHIKFVHLRCSRKQTGMSEHVLS